ncbi:MAG: hypothetical protein E7L36_10635, partial [Prevotella bivia]|nr:hypothetical protein [Prevotella bivia]
RREMQTTSRYASRTSASLGEGYSFIALRFGTCNVPLYDILLLEHKYVNMVNNGQTDFTHFFDDTPNEISRELKDMLISVIVKILKP